MGKELRTESAASLDELMELHIAAQRATVEAVREWDARRAAEVVSSVVYANGLLRVARDEEAGRREIVNYRPRNDQESRMKLTYMAAYVIATRGSLSAEEMDSILDMTHP